MAAPPRPPQQRKQDTLHRLQQDVDAWVAASRDGELPRPGGAHRGGRIEPVDDEGADGTGGAEGVDDGYRQVEQCPQRRFRCVDAASRARAHPLRSRPIT